MKSEQSLAVRGRLEAKVNQSRGIVRWSVPGVFGALMLLSTGSVAAETKAFRGSDGLEPTLAVIGVEFEGAAGMSAEAYQKAVASELAESNTLALLEASAVRDRISARYGSTEDFETQRKRFLSTLQRGEDLAFDDPASSIGSFQESRELFRAMSGVHDVDPDLRARGFAGTMQLAFAYLESQDQESAVRVLQEGMSEFGTDMEVSDEVFHPSLVALYQSTLAGMADTPRGGVSVVGFMEGDAVLVNGVAQDMEVPGVVPGLVPGQVRVQLVRDGQTSSPVSVSVVPDEVAQVTPTLALDSVMGGSQGVARFASIQAASAALPGLARALGALTGADVVGLVGVTNQGGVPHLTGFLVDSRTGDVVQATPRLIKEGVFSNKRVVETSSELLGGAGLSAYVGSGGQWHTSIAGWSLTGVGVIGLAVAGVFAGKWSEKNDVLEIRLGALGDEPVGAPSQANNWSGSPGWNKWKQDYDTAETIQGEAQSAETIAWAAGITGIISVGAGVAFFIMANDDGDVAESGGSSRSFFAGPMLFHEGEPTAGMVFSGGF